MLMAALTHSSTVCVPSPPDEVADQLDALLAPLGDHVGGAELAAQVGAVLVVAHEHDPLRAEPPGGQHPGQPDRAVADDRHRRARPP
jgi:hypothetical protein